jgi:hypothetical protein
MKSTPKDMFLGIIFALVAFYVYFTILIWNTQDAASFFISAFFLLLYTFWIVIPMGAVLGIIIPKMVYDKTPKLAALQGAAIGIAAAIIIVLGLSIFYGISESWLRGFLQIAGYFVAWTTIYALTRARRSSLYR